MNRMMMIKLSQRKNGKSCCSIPYSHRRINVQSDLALGLASDAE